MKPSLGVAGFLVVTLLFGWHDFRSSPPAARAEDSGGALLAQDGKAKLSDADLKKLSDAFNAMWVEGKKQEQARKDFMQEYERIDKLVKPNALLAMHEVWTEIFYMRHAPTKAPTGMGRVEEKTLPDRYVGKPVEFHYGLLLPNGFDPKKRYPLIVALHDAAGKDEKVNGPKYLEDVWMKVPKDERDKYIIIAPTMGTGAAGKDFRVEWGDLLHIYSVYRPVIETVKTLPIDIDRIFLEGTGEGGEFAWQLGLYKPHFWAGVGVRSALPRMLPLLPNCVSLPIQVNLRQGSPQQIGAAHEKFEKERKDLPITVNEYPAAEKPLRSAYASDMIPEASAAIIQFFGKTTRNLAAKKLSFTTDSINFKECYWTRLVKYDTGDKPGERYSKITGTVNDAENTIDLKTEGIEVFRVYLNDRLVNMDRPVKLTVNGKPHTERQFTRSLDTFLQYYAKNTTDPGLQPTAVVEVEVPTAAESKPSTPDSAPAPPK